MILYNVHVTHRCGHRLKIFENRMIWNVPPSIFPLCSPCACVEWGGGVVLRKPTIQTHAVRIIGDSKLSIGVSVTGRLSLCEPLSMVCLAQ